MESIPPIFWMFIISVLAIGVFLILFYVAMAVRELISTIRESTGVLREVKDIAKEAKVIIADVKTLTNGVKNIVAKFEGTADAINNSIVRPIQMIGGFLSSIAGFVTGDKEE